MQFMLRLMIKLVFAFYQWIVFSMRIPLIDCSTWQSCSRLWVWFFREQTLEVQLPVRIATTSHMVAISQIWCHWLHVFNGLVYWFIVWISGLILVRILVLCLLHNARSHVCQFWKGSRCQSTWFKWFHHVMVLFFKHRDQLRRRGRLLRIPRFLIVHWTSPTILLQHLPWIIFLWAECLSTVLVHYHWAIAPLHRWGSWCLCRHNVDLYRLKDIIADPL